MKILAIESSCDETAAAIVEDGTKILSNVVASSVEMHAKTGGIIPEVAAREQVKCIIPVIQEALNRTDFSKSVKQYNSETVIGKTVKKVTEITDYCSTDSPLNRFTDIDAIAVTVGPGLVGSLLVGIETAKTLAYLWQKPIVPINHLVGHIYANWLNTSKPVEQLNRTTAVGKTVKKVTEITDYCSTDLPFHCFTEPNFPAIALVVSGGHTDLVLMKNHGKIEWLGGTRDDAGGECFDKSARLLDLPYPGGPSISAAAQQYSNITIKQSAIRLPRPLMDEDNFDFSFSGLKTAVLREVQDLKNNQQYNNITVEQLSYELQEAITDVLVTKTIRAAEKYKVKSILLAGGVSANQRLREKMHLKFKNLKFKIEFWCPPPKLCTDNAAYIASCAYFNYKPVPWQDIKVNPGLTISDKI
ncbi:tRNA (adenosine(37)-N6)-threonylcarbamoyltransferase complex transferase subunit TsaD [Candidatus Shapirobacteria bacterium CG08_land_8_20_14_0_20_39_18]|uniref:tRNA N6-adenosine threonylcarbamoyltransferase n=1 Tax=Candidatus Shapirobacteria bacterium CG08_land_8_20_14_0_20_39_18 TaxID=1974883 RepID=A0A2M6XCQ2_9BACT|nr:MAG: tRNA (adenosine(37)-N6)-threonylcarbamoyltransferase complex transferase subunit TsaD [Candidatus Shapirobacteria bacterium CG08_land_8_20_14_0_20_39_18]PIY65086.1 MAG: tRNA (adenosine(37)-N6)-threonylcarbamoyltransferase complex transferase subunit TsaD [Candidatus Shapirobacteria bacterium CG_4_10_14_0_8_um_filter_39_15]